MSRMTPRYAQLRRPIERHFVDKRARTRADTRVKEGMGKGYRTTKETLAGPIDNICIGAIVLMS